MVKISVAEIFLKITYLSLLPHRPGVSGLSDMFLGSQEILLGEYLLYNKYCTIFIPHIATSLS